MSTESRPSPGCSSLGVDRCSASDVSTSDTKPFRALKSRFVAGVLSLATATMTVRQNSPNVPYARGPTNRPAAIVVSSTRQLMSRLMQILQLNMQKRREVQHSVMNDASLKEYTALVISEPYVFEMNRKVRTSPIGHQSWTAILPSQRHDGR